MSSNGLYPAKDKAGLQRLQDLPSPPPQSKGWRVIHACEYARDVLPVVEGQVAAGMRPYIVTPQGAGSAELYLSGSRQEQPRPLSLLRSWQDVRNWRKSILECDPENAADLVHAHSFASGMAAVRNVGCVVYDFTACIEELAIVTHQAEPGSWMGRSFRVAEQFILARVAAVIVHSHGLKKAAEERGAAPESIFLIPEPLAFEEESFRSSAPPSDFLERRFRLPAHVTAFFVPRNEEPQEKITREMADLLQAFALADPEHACLHLLVQPAPGLGQELVRQATLLGIQDCVSLVDDADAPATLESAHVVVATGESPSDPVAARRADEHCLRALWRGKALLAADVPRNRDASPEGRGCLWFENGNPRDLAHRMAFLGRHPDLVPALAAAGRMFMLDTRNSSVIGRQYRAAYRFAASRRRTTGAGPSVPSFEPVANLG